MPSLYRRLDRVRSMPAGLAEAALVASLPHASASERDAIVAELLELTVRTKRLGGLEAVLRHWAELSEDARRAATVVGLDHIDRLITRAVSDGLPSARRAAGRLLCGMSAGLDAYSASELSVIAGAVAELARDADPSTSGDALDALAAIASHGGARCEELRGIVDRALTEAADTWQDHRHNGILDAIVLRAHHAGPLLRQWLADTDQPAHMPLRSAARRLAPESMAPRLVRWLSIPALAPVAVQRLASTPNEAERRAALTGSHLLLNPRRHAAVARLGACDALLASIPATPERSDERVGLVRWLGAVRLPAAKRLARLASLIGTNDAHAQWAALRAIADGPATAATDGALLDFALAADARVASFAASRLSMSRSPLRWRAQAGAVACLRRSPHGSVRRAVDESANRRSPWPEAGDRWACAVAARAALEADRAGFVLELRKRLNESAPEDRLSAVQLAARLSLVPEIEDELIRAACGADHRLASKAVLLLRHSTSPGAAAAIQTALRSEDGRVRASAVEAAARQDGGDARLAPFVSDPTPRVRANTIAHFLSTARTRRSASVAICEMLSDERAPHRLSALWAAEAGRQTELADLVREMAMRDVDGAVRRRAERCARTLTAVTRLSWSGALSGGAPRGEAR